MSESKFRRREILNRLLIKEVQRYEYLYNNTHPDFQNNLMKEDAWEDIAAIVGEPVEQCKNRWKDLKKQHAKEHLKVTTPGFVRTSYWRYADAMAFMRQYVEPKSSTSSVAVKSICKSDMFCRTCLCRIVDESGDQSSKSYKIFEIPDLADKLTQCSNRQVVQFDEYPQSVCEKCYKKIVYFSQFQSTCQESLEKFNAMLHDPKQAKFDFNETLDPSHNDLMKENTSLASILEDNSRPKPQSKEATQNDTSYTDAETELVDEGDNIIMEEVVQVEIERSTEHCANNAVSNDNEKVEEFSKLVEETLEYETDYEEEDGEYVGTKEEHLEWLENEDLSEDEEIVDEFPNDEASISDGSNIRPTSQTSTNHLQCDVCPQSFRFPHRLEAHQRRHQGLPGYACPYENCERAYNRLIDLRRHLDDHNGVVNYYKCDIIDCDKFYTTYSGLSHHKRRDHQCMKEYHPDKPLTWHEKSKLNKRKYRFKCDICPKTFRFRTCLEAHQRRHQGLSGYPCPYENCDRAYNRMVELRNHLNDHNGIPNVYKCDFDNCDRIYSCYSALNHHKREYHKCGKELTKHKSEQKTSKTYMCEGCGKVFPSLTKFNEHHLLHVDESQWPYVCDVDGCSKRFRAMRKLKVHQLRHAGIRNYVCPYCEARKTTPTELYNHINCHTQQRTYACHLCHRVCTTRGNLRGHIRSVHEGIKYNGEQKKEKGTQYTCRFCDRKFSRAYFHEHHERTHMEEAHECRECGKTFSGTLGLKAHMKLHWEGEEIFACDECGKEFRWKGYLEKHKKLHMKKKMEYDQMLDSTATIQEEEEEDSVENLVEVVELFDCTILENNT